MNPLETSLINAEKALKWAWEKIPGYCRKELPPKNLLKCKI